MSKLISSLWNNLLDIIYPRYCLECGKNLASTEHFYLCLECISKITFVNQFNACPKCGLDLGPYTEGNVLCRDCAIHKPRFDKAFAVARYDGIMRNVILKLKYQKDKPLAVPLSRLAAKTIEESKEKTDLIMPVPLCRTKLKERGFNQSKLLAEGVANILKIKLSSDNILKIKETRDQAGLDGSARRENLKDAFSVSRPSEIKDKKVLLVDDVLTTGTTISEISRVLKKAGANKVFACVLAHGR
ncbi:MAG: ComF family protein [Planctomycetota bacterium]